jgi:Rrf2 family protein
MKLTKKAEYAIKAMGILARNEGKLCTIKAIADEHKMPKKFLEQILLALKTADLVVSKAGPHGGYRLARPAEQITLGDILTAVGDPLGRPARRSSKTKSEELPLEKILREIRQCLSSKVREVSLRDLASSEVSKHQVEELMWYI